MKTWWQSNHSARGFTFLEVIAVLVLLGLLAGLTTLSLRGALRAGRLDDAVEQFAAEDRMMRRRAENLGRGGSLHLSVGQAPAIRLGTDPSGDARALRLAGAKIERVLLAAGTLKRVDYGEATVNYSGQGFSPTYAVLITADRRQWVLVAGFTGQVTRFDDERQVLQLLERLTAN